MSPWGGANLMASQEKIGRAKKSVRLTPFREKIGFIIREEAGLSGLGPVPGLAPPGELACGRRHFSLNF